MASDISEHCLAGSRTVPGYAFSVLVVSLGGNLSTDSPVRRQKASIQLVKVPTLHQIAVGRNLCGVVTEGRCCDSRNFPRTRLSERRPGPGWCRLFLGERRNWKLPLGRTAAQGCWMLPRCPDSQHQECFAAVPVGMLAGEVADKQTGCGNVGMAVGVSRKC